VQVGGLFGAAQSSLDEVEWADEPSLMRTPLASSPRPAAGRPIGVPAAGRPAFQAAVENAQPGRTWWCARNSLRPSSYRGDRRPTARSGLL